LEISKLFIVLGIVFLALGLLGQFLGFFPLGNLPGDISIKRENFSFHFPIVSSILISLILSLILWLLTK
jgi:hypothetical protein